MIDTIKVLIPLNPKQHERIRDVARETDRWTWVLHNQSSGELLFRKVSGLFKTDSHSYHREIKWDVDESYEPGRSYLTVELSLPKFWYGHNISLLYGWLPALELLRKHLNEQLRLRTRLSLPDIDDWELRRVDVCYAWRFPDQNLAQLFLDSLKALHFPNKKPTIYPESILFKGNTYSVKFYLKLPEFKTHDLRELLKQKASLEWVEHLESIATGVLRMEVTLRHRYLKRNGINTVRELREFKQWFEWENPPENDEDAFSQMFVLSAVHLDSLGVDLLSSNWHEQEHALEDGLQLEAPPGLLIAGDRQIEFPGNKATFHKIETPIYILQKMLKKFVGEDVTMRTVDKVHQALSQHYKPAKAMDLAGFWLCVRQLGSQRVKDEAGSNSYYYKRRQLMKAGINLLEPPDLSKVTPINRGFMEGFLLSIPSPNVSNAHDDFRDSQNVLNFVPKAN